MKDYQTNELDGAIPLPATTAGSQSHAAPTTIGVHCAPRCASRNWLTTRASVHLLRGVRIAGNSIP